MTLQIWTLPPKPTLLLKQRDYYKPFDYPWAYDAYKQQQRIHWLPEEVPMADDISDWNTKLSVEEKAFLTQLFRFFVQGDVNVAWAYNTVFIPAFKGIPELAMMLNSFAAMEAIHVDAYANLIDSLNLPEVEYSAFLDYQVMKEKHEANRSEKGFITDDIILLSTIGEGLQLFSSFAMLLNFPRFGKMKGMGQIVTWSIRDESLHVQSMIQVFKALPANSKPSYSKVEEYFKQAIELEDKFIELCFKNIPTMNKLEEKDVKAYIRYMANLRMQQLGYPRLANATWDDIVPAPFEWMDEMLNSTEHANFFEARATEYSKGAIKGDIGEIKW